MAAPMDALTSFTHLSDNIPDWLVKLDDLATQVAEQHSRFTRITQFTEIKLARKKHDSTESLRPKDLDNENDDAALVVSDTTVPPGQSHLVNANIDSAVLLKDIRRKRKPGSAFSGASGPQRYRTRSMIIVYYDSAIQDAFDSVVRNIATARNNLRKGKTSVTFKARMAALGMEENPFAAVDDYVSRNSRIRSRYEKPSRQNPNSVPSDSTLAFENADKDLEAAQNLCEVAAHQFLRDGDCMEEIQGTREKFEHCLRIAHKEMEWIKAEKVEKASGPHERPSEDEYEVEKIDIPAPKPVSYDAADVIEVDNESDASSVHIDLSAFRRSRRI